MALTVGSITSSKGVPKSVAQITKDASEYEFDAIVPLKYYLRTANAMVRQAQVYMREGDDEMTFFLLFRHAHLCLSHLATHPQYKQQDPEMIKALEREVSQNLKAMELLKARINRRYEEYAKVSQTRETRRQEDAEKRRASQGPVYLSHDQDQRISQPPQIRGQEHSKLAARLAGQEFARRAPNRRSYPTGLSQPDERDDLAARMQAIRTHVEPKERDSTAETNQQRQANLLDNAGYSYPTVPIQRPIKAQSHPPEAIASRPLYVAEREQPPVLPPKPVQSSRASTLPPRPEKQASPAVPSNTPSEPAYTFAPGAYLENGTPLRTIFLPPTLRTTFLRLAHKNTTKNLETCGFLAGTLRANALFVSALVVPKQTATSDTCEMTDESELFDYVDQHELMVLGWIHTHPTQTCFMSSRDLHTHSGYQMMLTESIAIVCAPSKGDTSRGGDWGVYRLTDPPGKMAILQCDKPGIFHPHDVDNIYTDAMRPGHVMEIGQMDFEIVDLR
ncbi:hypothetical protein LTR70_001889 [Exophiala xenobiotica]|uniref:MPN domain-containing protein n=1 Tax=Lithohypha guttulata TaxID=1690604 RepID=A0ABR0KAY8_9EURO|nr:hypothetical protein LTR24_005109 [Lithohypha guttulata]KAK5326874.1 hypothetical protein LTR70_001889 [Exophiala xenobiotica]